VCLGDIVGYGPDPGACLQLIRQKTWHIVAGNHDLAAASGDIPPDMNPEAVLSSRWTSAMIANEEKIFLAGLPLQLKIGPFHFVHGSPYAPSLFHYVMNPPAAKKAFLNSPGKYIFVGHSHVPAVFIEAEYKRMFAGCIHNVEPILSTDVKIIAEKRYLINVGSVGQPRDGDNRAAYGLMSLKNSRFELIRVPYDVDAAVLKIKRHGLPDSLAKRLKTGR
jgi:diadenosine tetraphosphatase ApaH/serine/threonine PP2A family protein phosphatase